jgi:phosphatidylglycerol:prolipoprotein diacylglycerol transferase
MTGWKPIPRFFHNLFATGFMLIWLGRRGVFRGQLIKLYLLSYLGYRFVTEFIRPEHRIWFGITGYQAAV